MPLDIAVSADGQTALSVEEVTHRGHFSGSFDLGVFLRIRVEPNGPLTRVGVTLDPIFVPQLEEIAVKAGVTGDMLVDDVVLAALGDYLDENGLPPFVEPGENATLISGDAEAQAYFDRALAPPLADDAVLLYMAAKIYWGWRYGMREVTFTGADARRCHVQIDQFPRLGLAGDTTYWTRSDSSSFTFSPRERLLGEFPAGLFPGMQRPLVHRVTDRLAAPRYDAPREHFAKALEFLNSDTPDVANAVKEATAAVEAMSLRILGKDSGTLGDSIKELRGRGLLSPALAKALEGLWGFASEEPGIRHGKLDAPAVKPHEGVFAVNLAASAVLLLLDLDK